MQKKEYYKHNLSHFQQPGQAYFVTWSLKDAVPKHKMKHFAIQLEILKSQIETGLADSDPPLESQIGIGETQTRLSAAADFDPLNSKSRIEVRDTRKKEMDTLKKQYNLLRKKYIKAFNDLLDAERKPAIDLSKTENTKVISDALGFWESKRLKNHGFCIMPNHVHWVFELLEKDEDNNPVYLQDIMYSVKRFTANEINKLENRKGELWQKESFDTTIRDEKHLYYAIEYTLNNPVSAGLVKERGDWRGSWFTE